MRNNEGGANAAPETPAKKSTNSLTHNIGVHGAELAADAAAWWNTMCWTQAIERAAADGGEFTADDLQRKYDLPDIGPATGGVFMRARRAGTIQRVGYRPSEKASRAGGVVAIWTGGSCR